MNCIRKTFSLRAGFHSSLSFAVLLLTVPAIAFSQVGANNSYSRMLDVTSTAQSTLTQQMINLGGKPTTGSGAPVCLPPIDLQRGPAGLVPPQLQGDPRYQEYLHCRYGNVPITAAMANAPALPVSPASGGATRSAYTNAGSSPIQTLPPIPQHYPLAATDFVPVQLGHPVIEQQIASLPISREDRARVVSFVNATLTHVARNYRPNNLTVSICIAYAEAQNTLNGTPTAAPQMQEFIARMSDAIATTPAFRQMSDAQKQNISDTWIFETSILAMLKSSAARGDTQAAQQAIQLAQVVMQNLNVPPQLRNPG